MGQSEAELIAAARAGSREATVDLVRRHWGRCHRIAFLIIGDVAAAEDATQEAILSALRALDGFDETRPLEPWLHRIVVNEARDWLRKRAREPELVDDLEWSAPGATEPDLPPLPAGEVLEEVRRLRPAYRLVVVLRYVLDYTPTEIAAALEIPAPTVRTRLRRALIELRRALDVEEANDAIAP